MPSHHLQPKRKKKEQKFEYIDGRNFMVENRQFSGTMKREYNQLALRNFEKEKMEKIKEQEEATSHVPSSNHVHL